MKVAIFSTNVAGIYSGGRYLSLIMAYSLAKAGVEVCYYTNLVPTFNGDFEDLPEASLVNVIAGDTWPITGDPSVDWVIVIPTGSVADEFYAAAKHFAKRSNADIALLSFETSNWFNAMVGGGKSPLPWEGWASVVAEGGAVITIADEGQLFAEPYYANQNPSVPIVYDYWHPAINDFAAEKIDWKNIPKYPNRIMSFIRVSDDHKGAAELLSFPNEFFKHKTLCLVFGRGVDVDFVTELRAKTQNVIGCTILLYAGVTDEEKLALLASSTALLFPSKFEGFGYPPVEAAYVGTPTIAYNLPVVRETLGSKGRFVAVGDTNELARVAHQLSAAWSPVSKRITIPARCTREQAGHALVATLERAKEQLSLVDPAAAGQSTPIKTDWSTPQSVWGWCDITCGDDSTLNIKALITTRHRSSKISLKLNGVHLSGHGMIVRHPYPGGTSIEGILPIGLLDIAEALELQVYIDGAQIGKILPIVCIDPTQRLTRQSALHPAQTPATPIDIHIAISDESFGQDFKGQFALGCVASELHICGLTCELSAPRTVLDRLADQPALFGLFDRVTVVRKGSKVAFDGPVVSLRETTAIQAPELLHLTPQDARKPPKRVELLINVNADLLKAPNRALLALQAEINRSLSEPKSISLLNAVKNGKLSETAQQLVFAIKLLSGDEPPVIYCVCTGSEFENLDQGLAQGYALVSWITEHQFYASLKAPDCAMIDCTSDWVLDTDPKTVINTVLSNLSETANVQSLRLTVPSLLGDAFCSQFGFEKIPEMPTGRDVLAGLRRARERAGRLLSTRQNQSEHNSRKRPFVERETLSTLRSCSPKLDAFAKHASTRVSTHQLEFRARDGAQIEFRVPQGATALKADLMCLVWSEVSKNATVSLQLNHEPPKVLELPTNRWNRIQTSATLNTEEFSLGQHCLQIRIEEAEEAGTISLRALGLLVDGAASPDSLSMNQAQDRKRLVGFESPPRIHVKQRPRVELQMNSPASIVAVGRGWGRREKNYRWTLGRIAEFYVPDLASAQALDLSVSAGAFLAPGEKAKQLGVQINGQQIGVLEFSDRPERKTIEIPANIAAAGFARIDFLIETPRSPKSLGVSGDSRELGFCVYQIELHERGG